MAKAPGCTVCLLSAPPIAIFPALYFHTIKEAGEGKPHYGRFTILDRPSVQYTWIPPNTRGLESLVTVSFQKKGEDTLLTLRHENLPDDENGRSHENGWGYLLSRFADRFPRDRG
jgi:hypothetical protein